MKVLPMVPAVAAPVERSLATAVIERIEDGVVRVIVGDGPAIVARLALPPGAAAPEVGSEVVVLLENDASPVIVSAILSRLPMPEVLPPKVVEL